MKAIILSTATLIALASSIASAAADSITSNEKAFLEAVAASGGGKWDAGASLQQIGLTTGHEAKAIDLCNGEAAKQAAVASDFKDRIDTLLATSFQNNKLVTTGMNKQVFTVSKYDKEKKILTVYDPRKLNGFETWPNGQQGPLASKGFFEVPLADFVSNFQYMAYEAALHDTTPREVKVNAPAVFNQTIRIQSNGPIETTTVEKSPFVQSTTIIRKTTTEPAKPPGTDF